VIKIGKTKQKNIWIEDQNHEKRFLRNRDFTKAVVYLEDKYKMTINIRDDMIEIEFPNMKVDTALHIDYGRSIKRLLKNYFHETKIMKTLNVSIKNLIKKDKPGD
jgi:hypothetical protein